MGKNTFDDKTFLFGEKRTGITGPSYSYVISLLSCPPVLQSLRVHFSDFPLVAHFCQILCQLHNLFKMKILGV